MPAASGPAAIAVTPEEGLRLQLELRDSVGGPAIATAGPGQPGAVVQIDPTLPLSAGTTYYLRVSGPGAAEGKYCADSAYAPGRPCTTDTSGGGDDN